VTISPPAQAAATYLREILSRPGRPRRAWEQHSERARADQVNQLAVAEVLAQHLWANPRKRGDDQLLPRQLKDTVSRALSGQLLTRRTLELFMDAFHLPDGERDHLWRLWEGSPQVRMFTGSGALSETAEQRVRAASGPPGHQTLSLHDHVEIDVMGRVRSVRTIQVVEALRDGLDRIPYVYDTSVITLETRHGCAPPAEAATPVQPDIYVSSLPLVRSLARGETLTLEYVTRLRYQGDVTPDQLNYRRAVRRWAENLDLRVQFDPDNVPPHVWWAVWDGVDGDILEQQPAELDGQHSAHRYLRLVEKTVLGFYWTW
jgi:hypothetical protein